jgi:GTP-binding protein EngB required for normal cell division
MIDKQNDVSRLLCPTPQILDQGLLETQHLPHICIAGESNAGKSS